MCGIAGILCGPGTTAERSAIQAMTRTMTHRGPDAEGYFIRGRVALGHRRLKIIDLEGGVQPMFNEDESVVVVFNGEIFNFREVRVELERRGHRFQTDSDTEVIVHAYEEYGDACPTRFRGMFAFAVYDLTRDRLLLARDRLGIKPLYYCVDGGRLLFASEIKAILLAIGQKPGVASEGIDFYVSLGYVPGERTLFRNIFRVPPAHTLAFADGQRKLQRYWGLEHLPPLEISTSEAKDRLDFLLRESVRLRMISDVPLGAFLSGGLDSSAVVALMSRLTGEPVKTFSVGYRDDPASSELRFAKVVADTFRTEHHEYILESEDFFASLELLLEHSEEPIVESAAVALYQLSRLAREHVTVILSGEGGDEILAGYPLYGIMPKVDLLHRIGALVPEPLWRASARWAGKSEKRLKYWDWTRETLSKRYQGISNDVTDSIKRNMYSEDYGTLAGSAVKDYFCGLFETLQQGSSLRRMTYVDLQTWLPDDLLLKADKMTMACSLELRVPLLDHHLLEFATALPDKLRRQGAEGKYLLKKVMEPYLPREIIYRAKKGFPVPIARWFRGPLFERIRDILLDSRTLRRGYFRPEYVRRVLERHRAGSEDLSRRIFSLLALELWHRKYID